MASTHLKEKTQAIRHLTTDLHRYYQRIEDSLVYILGLTHTTLGIKLKLESN